MANLQQEVARAAELQTQLDRLNGKDRNLSPKGAIAEAKRLGGADKEADRVIAEIEGGSADGQLLEPAFRRLCVVVRSFSRTSILKSDRMGGYLGDSVEALSRMQVSRASLMLAVVRYMTANKKDLWGTQDSPATHASAIAETKAELEAGYQRIEAALTLADFTVHPMHDNDRADGKSRLTFKLTGDALALGDGRDVGPHLVSWWLSQNAKARKAA